MLEIKGVSAGYDSVDVLHGIDIVAESNDITVLLGANGSGKSTLFKTVSGLIRPTAGTIRFEGRELNKMSANKIVKLGVAHCPEGRHLFGNMPVEKNLGLGAYTHGGPRKKMELLERVYELFPILAEKRHQNAGSLSGGQQQMVAIGRALMSDPKLLILDEPSMGLAPLIVRQVLDAVVEINSAGIGVLLAEQNAKAALSIASKGVVISEGRVVVAGDASTLLSNPEVQAAYLGM